MDSKDKSLTNNTRLDSESQPSPSRPSSTSADADPPPYFDSEPTSQPPAYQKPKTSPKQWTGPASAASISAIMGPPPPKKEKMSVRDRWRDLMYGDGYSGADGPQRGREGMGSRTTWNVQGAECMAKEKRRG